MKKHQFVGNRRNISIALAATVDENTKDIIVVAQDPHQKRIETHHRAIRNQNANKGVGKNRNDSWAGYKWLQAKGIMVEKSIRT